MRLSNKPVALETELLPPNSDGRVSRWTALWCLALLGAGFVCAGVLPLLGYIRSGGNEWVSILLGSLAIAPLAYYAARIAVARSVTRRLVPEWQLRERLNIDESTFRRLVSIGDARPRFIVDGKRYYTPADFASITLLLRGASAPDATAPALLRPAAGTATSHAQLLRPSSEVEQASNPQTARGDAQRSEPRSQQDDEIRMIERPLG